MRTYKDVEMEQIQEALEYGDEPMPTELVCKIWNIGTPQRVFDVVVNYWNRNENI